MEGGALSEAEGPVKSAAIALATALLFALPVLAGPDGICPWPDIDSDGTCDVFDNCSAKSNTTQRDDDSDGYGDICDCDYNNDNSCDGRDFLILAGNFGKPVPSCPPPVDQDDDGVCAGSDFLLFGGGFGQPPGPACGHPKGTPCPP